MDKTLHMLRMQVIMYHHTYSKSLVSVKTVSYNIFILSLAFASIFLMPNLVF